MTSDAVVGRPELVNRIREVIAYDGPITFDRFMELALYEPGLGYYTAQGQCDAPGGSPATDFQTSAQVHPAFGHLLAVELLRVWEALGKPRPFVVAEPGAGPGELAAHILAGLAERAPGLTVEYHAADARLAAPSTFPLPLTEGEGEGVAFRRLIPGNATIITWPDLDILGRSGTKVHCVFSNEFFDALPIHRLIWLGGALREIRVDWVDRGFVERLGAPSVSRLADLVSERYASGGELPTEGWRGEICTRYDAVLRTVGRLIDRGVVLTIDYGYGAGNPGDELPMGETLVAYHRHLWNDDPYRRVGEQDLTSHVDFGALLRIGRRFGLEPAGAMTQRDFLLHRGLTAEAERRVSGEATPGRKVQTRFAIDELIRRDGLGRLEVVAQQKGVSSYALA